MGIWLLASETHLTVLCSLEKSLCSASEQADVKRAFSKIDTEGNGFIQETHLPDLMKELEQPHDDQNVLRVKEELDSEDLGIITLGSVLQKYLPQSVQLSLQSIGGAAGAISQDDQFQVMTDIPFIHYNGLNFKQNPNANATSDASDTTSPLVVSATSDTASPLVVSATSDSSSNTPRDANQSFSYGIGVIGLDAGGGGKESKLDLILSTRWPAVNIAWSLGPRPLVDC